MFRTRHVSVWFKHRKHDKDINRKNINNRNQILPNTENPLRDIWKVLWKKIYNKTEIKQKRFQHGKNRIKEPATSSLVLTCRNHCLSLNGMQNEHQEEKVWFFLPNGN